MLSTDSPIICYAGCHCAECRIFCEQSIVMLGDVILMVIMFSVVLQSAIILKLIMHSVVMLSVTMLNVGAPSIVASTTVNLEIPLLVLKNLFKSLQ